MTVLTEQWEEVASDPWTMRLRVPGGWLYCVADLTDNIHSVTFVPDPKVRHADRP